MWFIIKTYIEDIFVDLLFKYFDTNNITFAPWFSLSSTYPISWSTAATDKSTFSWPAMFNSLASSLIIFCNVNNVFNHVV